VGRDLPEGQGLNEPGAAAPIVVVHSLAHAVAALEAAAAACRRVTLISAPSAGIYAGPGWWHALTEAGHEAAPTAEASFILDCGDDAGAAQGAIRAGIAAVVFTGRADVAMRLAAIAEAAGGRVLTRRPVTALDLGHWFFADRETLRRHCAAWLASSKAIC